jgi:hypothetical protein
MSRQAKIQTSIRLPPDVRDGIRQVRQKLGLSETRQISDAWAAQYRYVYLPLIRAKDRADQGRGIGSEVIS